MVNTYAAQSGGCRFESLWGFGFSLKGAYYEVGYCGEKTFLAGLQCTLTSSCAKRKDLLETIKIFKKVSAEKKPEAGDPLVSSGSAKAQKSCCLKQGLELATAGFLFRPINLYKKRYIQGELWSDEKTRRKILKSALYLRLKNRQDFKICPGRFHGKLKVSKHPKGAFHARKALEK